MSELVSIIVPVYNVEKYLDECVLSILNQTYKYIEIILVDDGSTDGSGVKCDEFAKQDMRIRVVHKQNGGLSDARNEGMKLASGKYIYFCDSDDYIRKDCIEVLTGYMKNDIDFVIFNAKAFGDGIEGVKEDSYIRKREYPDQDGAKMLLRQLRLDEYKPCAYMSFFNNDFLKTNKIVFKKGIIGEDELFSFQTYEKARKVIYCPEALYFRRMRPGSIMTTKQTLRKFVDYSKIYQEMVAELPKIEAERIEAFNECVVRIAKSALLAWRETDSEQKESNVGTYKGLEESIRHYKGFGDFSLLVRLRCWHIGLLCSGVRRFLKEKNYK